MQRPPRSAASPKLRSSGVSNAAMDRHGGLPPVVHGMNDEAWAAHGIASGIDLGQRRHLVAVHHDGSPFIGLDSGEIAVAGNATGSNPYATMTRSVSSVNSESGMTYGGTCSIRGKGHSHAANPIDGAISVGQDLNRIGEELERRPFLQPQNPKTPKPQNPKTPNINNS